MKPALVIADDLTGALDTGVCFTQAGFSAALVLSPHEDLSADVLVYSTESRSVEEREARKRTRALISSLQDAALIYKKIDSTLRGFPGPELAEIIAGLRFEKALVAPAFPAQGRTTLAGQQRIDGLPIQRSSFQREVGSSDLASLFAACGLPVRSISLDALHSGLDEVQRNLASPGPAIFIADAETEADLHALAGAALRSSIRLYCGSAGLAAALAEWFPRREPASQRLPFRRRPGAVLGVVGSRNPVSIQQVKAARESGVFVMDLDPVSRPGSTGPPGRSMSTALAALSHGQDVILAVSNPNDSLSGPLAVAEQLAQGALDFMSGRQIGGLVLSGGETAMAVLCALKASGVRLIGEFLPGLPLGTLAGGEQPGLPIITKAGGFGDRDALLKALQFLRSGKDV